MKKQQNGLYEIPSLYDASGSADFRNQTHDGFCVYRYFGEDDKTVFINLKTKFSFQGEIGKQVEFDYHLPSGRYYALGTEPPTHSLIDDSEYEPIKYNTNPSEAFEFPDDDLDSDVPF